MPNTPSPLLQSYSSEPGLFPLLDACVGRLARRNGDAFKIEQETLRHIADWLRAALVNDEPWLKNLDAQGRPKKLMKFGSMNAIMREADKAMLKAAQKPCGVKLGDGDEVLYAEIGDGFYLVRLLTPAALDRESAEMHHCIGDGAYDERLEYDKHLYLSLRDPQGKAHATVEIEDRLIVQIQGKQNAPPSAKYLDVLVPYFRESGLNACVPPSKLGYVIDIEGTWHALDNLPEGLTVKGNLDLRGTQITRLPKGLTVSGYLNLNATPIAELPDDLLVGSDLFLGNISIQALPKGLTVGEDLFLLWSEIVSLPEGLTVGGDLAIHGTPIATLPKGLTVGGSLYLHDTPITALPQDLKVGKCIYIHDTPISALPEGLTVRDDLSLKNTKITRLPEDLSVGGRLYLDDTAITTLPTCIADNSVLEVRGETLTAKEFRAMAKQASSATNAPAR